MNKWRGYFSILRCLQCGKGLKVADESEDFRLYSNVNGVLRCESCGRAYPLFQDIPVMFNDDRTRMLLDPVTYKTNLTLALEKMRQASEVTGDALQRFKEKNDPSDALSWEILFWERWKQSDEGFIEVSRERIEDYLQHDNEGGGRVRFLNRILSSNDGDISGKHLLNIGAGRDFLLERILDRGCEVFEQDIVLESLLFLKKRGASFCVQRRKVSAIRR